LAGQGQRGGAGPKEAIIFHFALKATW
jgi:hypothetical protein